jgi:hypothetical protein
MDDHFSLRSKKSIINPRRFRFGRIFSTRRTEITEDTPEPVLPPTNPSALAQSSFTRPRRPSLPLLQTSFGPPRGASTYAKKALPAVPQTRAQELTCRRCYYSNARNCHGWVMGGTTGDACEQCLVCVCSMPLLLMIKSLTFFTASWLLWREMNNSFHTTFSISLRISFFVVRLFWSNDTNIAFEGQSRHKRDVYDMAMSTVSRDGVRVLLCLKSAPSGVRDCSLFAFSSLFADSANFTLWTRTDFLFVIAQDVQRIGGTHWEDFFGDEPANGLAL